MQLVKGEAGGSAFILFSHPLDQAVGDDPGRLHHELPVLLGIYFVFFP